MAKGENIFKRKDGRWEARYVKGYDTTGKIKYGYCYGKTYKDAKEKVIVCRSMLLNDTVFQTDPEKVKCFEYYCRDWLESKKYQIKESTYVKYATILDCHICRRIGSCKPEEITNQKVMELTNELLNESRLAPKTVKDILMVLRLIFKYVAKQYPGLFQAIDIVYPKEPQKEARVMTLEEQKLLVNYLMRHMDACNFGILLAMHTGLRIGELCALRWESISLKDRTIKISQTMQRLKDMSEDAESKTKIVVDSPKSSKSIRTIPLTENASLLCRQMDPGNNAAYILTGMERYMEPRALQYRLGQIAKDCGLHDVHFHTLRHTFATRCIEVGVEIKSLSEILGHASTTITLERYAHSSLDFKRSNLELLASVGY